MDATNTLSIVLTYSDERLDDAEREDLAQGLYQQLRAADSDLGAWRRVYVDAPPGTKSIGTQLVGVLAAVVSATSLKAFFGYLTERWRGQQISLEIDVKGTKMKLLARTQEELITAQDAAVALLVASR